MYIPDQDATSELLSFVVGGGDEVAAAAAVSGLEALPSAIAIRTAVATGDASAVEAVVGHTLGVYALDVRGKGVSRPDGDEIGSPYSMDFQVYSAPHFGTFRGSDF